MAAKVAGLTEQVQTLESAVTAAREEAALVRLRAAHNEKIFHNSTQEIHKYVTISSYVSDQITMNNNSYCAMRMPSLIFVVPLV